MCGITGIYNYKTQIEANEKIINEMNNSITYRGPDDEGIYTDGELGFGHRRLSIIDLSSAGHQPLSNEDNSIWVTFNGEIYNYVELIPELQKKGHVFKSKCDTEVILHAYEEYGLDCVEKFNGMFAFAIWDKNKKRLVLVRDRLGVKPLYYSINKDGIVFASEIKAILQHPLHKHTKADKTSIYDYINEGYLTGTRTLFEGINKLYPGTMLVLENEEIKERTYWKLQPAPMTSELSEEDFIGKLRETLTDSIKIRLRSDVPVGFHLSGGLDSSSIISISRKVFDWEPKTFSLRFSESPEYDENKFIQMVVCDSDTEHKELIPDLQKDFPKKLSDIVYLLDEPVDGPPVLSKFQINKFIKDNGITVALTGQGADELLGGYKRFLYQYIRSLRTPVMLKQFIKNTNYNELLPNVLDHVRLFAGNSADVITKLFRYSSNRFKESLFSDEFLATIKGKDTNFDHYVKMHPEVQDNNFTDLSKRMHYEALFYLQSLLHSEDRTGMGVSLETRTPFVDYRLVELTSQIPDYIKLKNLSTKYSLRKAMKGILPESIRLRKDKKGFSTPAAIWFRTSQKEFLKEIIFSDEFKSRGIFNVEYAKKLFDEHQVGIDHSLKLWYVLNLEIWFRQFIDNN